MATTTVTYSPAAGRQFVDLTSWAGDASFAATPVAGDQIEAVDTLTLNADGTVTGSDGTYTLRHIQALNGTNEAVSYSLTNPDVTAPTISTLSATGTDPDTIDVSVSTDEDSGTLYVFASANASETAAAIKTGAQGSQAVTATGTQTLALTLSTGDYYVHVMHEDAAGNQSNVLSSAQITLTALSAESASTTIAYSVGADKTLVTLESPVEPYLFENWATAPSAGEQLFSTTTDGTFDVNGNWIGDTEGVFDVWFVASDGALSGLTVDTNGLESIVDTTPAVFTFTDQTGVEPGSVDESNAITVSGVDAGEDIAVTITGGEYAVNAGSGFGAFTSTGTNVQLGYQIKVRNTASSDFETAANTTLTVGGVSDTFTRTTRAAVLPTQDVALPDLNLGETDTGSLDLDDYFSGASSYTLTGIPAGSGFSFSGSVLSWNTNKDDIAASPFTLTATAFSADGSINDAFSVTVVDDIGPAISINPLTTLDTAPIVSGSAGDATSLTLVVDGVTYNPTPSGGTWSQQLPTLALGDYTMTLNGEDANGNAAIEASATLSIVNELSNANSILQPVLKSILSPIFEDVA